MNIKSPTIFADTVDALTAMFVRSLNTTIVEGSIERHNSRLASRETGDRLTGTYDAVGEAWTEPKRCLNGRESAVRVQV